MGVGAVGAVADVYEGEGEDEGYEKDGCEDDLGAVSSMLPHRY